MGKTWEVLQGEAGKTGQSAWFMLRRSIQTESTKNAELPAQRPGSNKSTPHPCRRGVVDQIVEQPAKGLKVSAVAQKLASKRAAEVVRGNSAIALRRASDAYVAQCASPSCAVPRSWVRR
jgi:hypothetical protein